MLGMGLILMLVSQGQSFADLAEAHNDSSLAEALMRHKLLKSN